MTCKKIKLKPRSVLLALLCPVELQEAKHATEVAFENLLHVINFILPKGEEVSSFIWKKFNDEDHGIEGLPDDAVVIGYRDITRTCKQSSEYVYWNPSHPENSFFVGNANGSAIIDIDNAINPRNCRFDPEQVCQLDPDIFVDDRRLIRTAAITSTSLMGENPTDFNFPVYPGQTLYSNFTGEEVCKIDKGGKACRAPAKLSLGIRQASQRPEQLKV